MERIELTKEQFRNFMKGMEELCNDGGYDFSEEAFENNLDKWAKNKAHLLNVFAKSSDFNANELAIVKEVEIPRELQRDNANSLIYHWGMDCRCPSALIYVLRCVCNYTKDNGVFEFDIERYKDNSFEFYRDNYDYSMLTYVTHLYSQHYGEYGLAFLCKQLKIQSGTKATKVLNKIFDAIKGLKLGKHNLDYDFVKPVRELDENGEWTGNMCRVLNFNQFQAQLNDMLSPRVDIKKLVISINPLDYITQSRGNSWSSCHAFSAEWDDNYSGCNKGATLTMMVDPSSVIAYIIDNDNTSDLWNVPKQNRQSLFINNDHNYVMQNVFYPNHSDYLSKIVRQTIQDLLLATDTDSWVHSNRINYNYVDLNTDEYKGYDDWCKGVDVSYLKSATDSEIELIIGRRAWCVDNENDYVEFNSSVCSRNNDRKWCEYCDEYHDIDDMRWVEYYDRYFCDRELDEMYWCEDVDDYRFEDDCWYDEYNECYYSNDEDYEYVEDYGRVSRYSVVYSGCFYYCDHCGNHYYDGYSTPHYNHDTCTCYCDGCYEDLELDFDEE